MPARAQDEIDKLVISIFQINGALLAAGDQITAPYGITSARWQVLGALAFNENSLTIPHVARYMGLSRQAVIKQMKLLAADGLVQNLSNEAHKRSELWSLTAVGQRVYDSIMESQRALIRQWRSGLSLEEIRQCSRVLQTFENSVNRTTNSPSA
jgi:DNA-binding MarR family transcriptional regulator